MTNHDDEALTAKPKAAPVDDDRLTDKPAPEAPTDLKERAAEFDFAAWLAGMGPTRAVYPWRGVEIELQSRTPEYLTERHKEIGDLDVAERTLILISDHVTGPEGLPVRETLTAMREYAPIDYAALDKLLLALNTQPEAQINPRFLR